MSEKNISTWHNPEEATALLVENTDNTPLNFAACWRAIHMMENNEGDAFEYGKFLAGRLQILGAEKDNVEGLIWPNMETGYAGYFWAYTHPARRKWAGIKNMVSFLKIGDSSYGWVNNLRPAEEKDFYHSVNEETDWSDRGGFYRVHSNHSDVQGVQVYAYDDGEALECAIDYWEEQGWEGKFMDEESIAEYKKEGWEEEIHFGGNHGRAILAHEITITTI